jgi:hypothetical protein
MAPFFRPLVRFEVGLYVDIRFFVRDKLALMHLAQRSDIPWHGNTPSISGAECITPMIRALPPTRLALWTQA